jgi:predicted CXXCH cytochrome family protein
MRILSLLIICASFIFSNQKTNSPHGSDFKISCKTCHSSKGWQLDKEVYSFNHNKTNLPLVGQHTSLNCRQCHKTLVFKEAKSECFDCHSDIHQSTVGVECSRCHTPKSWLVNNISDIHQRSRFPLVGAHRNADCIQCHKSESMARFDVPGINCIDCHRESYVAATNPNHVQAGYPQDCLFCHPMNSFQWTGSGFNHSVFPLDQGHSLAKCSDCHKTGNYTSAKTDCYSCHQQDYLTSRAPDHSASKIPTNCLDCHTKSPGWKPVLFNHNSFPLTLGHAVPACIDCHKGGNYTSTPTDCYSCHQQDYLAAKVPDHNTSKFSTACQNCHTMLPGWKPTTFNHTGFPLTLGHAIPACIDCHKNGNYAAIPTDCYSCHQTNYTASTNPNHIASNIPTACATCHTTIPGWKPASYNHTTFPLTQGHSGLSCNDCHKGNYTTVTSDCYSCHQANYTATTNPNHITSGIPNSCATCHTTIPGWKPAIYNHTGFPLTLGHAIPTCNDCHKGNYTTLASDCYTCHQADYTGTTNPNHITAGISKVCSTCHTTIPGWKPATYPHPAFPLTQGHAIPSCNDCHKGNYTAISTDCYSCHQPNYTATTNPNHILAGIPTACATCHTTIPGWKPATYPHADFPLTQGHAIPSCNDCHKGGYTAISTDCYSCHLPNYTATTNPNHIAAGIPTTCATCHTTIPGWKPATFNHSSFPLTSGHSIPICNDCHKGNYTTTSTDCYSCHATDYNNSTNPNHTTAAIPKTCATCHTTLPGWKPATYTQHDLNMFPIYSGRHKGQWTLCTDCHTNTANYTLFDCKHCHTDAHKNSNYTNDQCYGCHKNGTTPG